MAYLEYYVKENVKYSNNGSSFKEEMNESETKYFYHRLKSQYQIRHTLSFDKRVGGNCGNYEIKVALPCTMGLLAHEVAHAIHMKKRHNGKMKGKRWHNKQHERIMNRVMRYIDHHKATWLEACRKKSERHMKSIEKKTKMRAEHENRKTTVDYKLEKTERQIKKWESKLKRAQNSLKKLERRKRFLLKKISTSPTAKQSCPDSQSPISVP